MIGLVVSEGKIFEYHCNIHGGVDRGVGGTGDEGAGTGERGGGERGEEGAGDGERGAGNGGREGGVGDRVGGVIINYFIDISLRKCFNSFIYGL